MIKSKTSILLGLLLWITTGAYAQQNHIFEGSFEDCKALAAQENKMILVDLYFEGCMPCAEMDKRVFPDPAVTELLQPHFILYKTDVFKEEDGMKMSRKYGVSGFPTYIMMDASGKTILIESGFFGVSRFVPLLQQAKQLWDEGQFLAFDTDLDKAYPTFYNYRFFRQGEQGEREDLNTYLEGKDLKQEVPFVISTMVHTPEINAWTYAQLPTLLQQYGNSLLRNKITRISSQKMQEFGKSQQIDSLAATLAYIRPVYNDRLWNVYLPQFVTSYYTGSQDAETYLSLIDQYKLYPTWELRSNALGPVIIDQQENTALLEKLRQEYRTAESKGNLDFTDQYKLTLLHFYVGDYEQAEAGVAILLKDDLSNPYLKIERSDLEALQTAIAKKDTTLFEAKNLVRMLGFSLDD